MYSTYSDSHESLLLFSPNTLWEIALLPQPSSVKNQSSIDGSSHVPTIVFSTTKPNQKYAHHAHITVENKAPGIRE